MVILQTGRIMVDVSGTGLLVVLHRHHLPGHCAIVQCQAGHDGTQHGQQ